ncbi:MAG: TonB-dependent receptor, partial [Luteibaculum sp.]
MKFLLGCLLLLAPYMLCAEHCRNTLTGKVFDAETKEPLAFANIFIAELKDGTVADQDGRFRIEDLCEGKFTLRITHVGCSPVIKEITIDGDQQIEVSLNHSLHVLEGLSVVADKKELGEGIGVLKLDREQMDYAAGKGIAELLENQSGLSNFSTGNNVNKPAIHGLTGQRLSIITQGSKFESQQWGSEHAPELDFYGSEKVEIIKGANALRYGSDNMGGLIRIVPSSKLENSGIDLSGVTGYSSLNRAFYKGAQLLFNTGGKLALYGQVSAKHHRGGNYRSPSSFIDNTGLAAQNISYQLGRAFKNWNVQLDYSRYDTELGVMKGAHIGNTSDLIRSIEGGGQQTADTFSYEISNPRQESLHEKIALTGKKSSLSWNLSRQYNIRQEFDLHGLRDSSKAALHLEITTWQAELVHKRQVGTSNLEIGIQGQHQKNTFENSYFIPGYFREQLGAFAISSFYLPKSIKVEAGARIDVSQMQAFAVRNLENRDTTLHFLVPSYHLRVDKVWSGFRISLQNGLSWRPPSPNELFAQGVHHASARIEQGQAQLKPETAINSGMELKFHRWEALELGVFAYYNFFNNYIYLEPLPQPALTIRGAFPEFVFKQTDTRHHGLDLNLSLFPKRKVRFDISGFIVRMRNAESGDFLPNFPADRLRFKSIYSGFSKKSFADNCWVEVLAVAKQNRLPNFVSESETNNRYFQILNSSPSGYFLLNAGFQGHFSLSDYLPVNFRVSLNNILNTQ